MPKEYLIRLPWPPAELSSNSTAKLRDKIRAKKMHRTAAFWLTKEQSVAKIPNAILEMTYHQPDNRHRDCQNMPASLKAAIDGIAMAMGCDDGKFRVRYPDEFHPENVKGGCVLVHIKPGASE